MRSTYCPPRLPVVAAMIDGEGLGHGPVVTAARMGSEIQQKAQSAAATTATPTERALAQAIRGDRQSEEQVIDQAIAELLLLVDDGPEASKLAAGLSQAFLRPDDSKAALAHDELGLAFAELYRRLVLHQLNSQVRNKAAELMFGLIHHRPGTLRPGAR